MEALRGPQREKAVGELRALLVRGLRATLRGRAQEEVEDFVQDAMIRILNNLDTFRGEARFTTWAQKIAVRVAYSEMRRQRWRDVSLQDLLAPYEGGEREIASDDSSVDAELGRAEMIELVRSVIQEDLTEKQRRAMLAVMAGGMPLEEVAARMGTNRGALYKLLHDARRKIKKRIIEKGLSPEQVLEIFEQG